MGIKGGLIGPHLIEMDFLGIVAIDNDIEVKTPILFSRFAGVPIQKFRDFLTRSARDLKFNNCDQIRHIPTLPSVGLSQSTAPGHQARD